MMFLDDSQQTGNVVLAISQPTHAWIAGELLRQWASTQDDMLILAAEQHDVAWMDWEMTPSFDAETGRPHLFRAIGAAQHAPLWALGVDRALAAWGSRVAMLISRHGTVIYTRFIDRHRLSDADAEAAALYVEQQAPLQAAWAKALDLTPAEIARDSNLIAFVDTVSLALCGELALPLDVVGPGVTDGSVTYHLARSEGSDDVTMTPWPFRSPRVSIAAEARLIPPGGFMTESDMRDWVSSAPRIRFEVALSALA